MKNFDSDISNILQNVYEQYIYDADLDTIPSILQKINLLVDNGLAGKVTGSCDPTYQYPDDYYVASKFITMYNKTLKKHKRDIGIYEYGGKRGVTVNADRELVELARCGLDAGTYSAQVSKKLFIILTVKMLDDIEDYIQYELCFIGKKWKKLRKKYNDQVRKYQELHDTESRTECILSEPDGETQRTIFKPFDKIVFNNKDKILAYIDHWIDNIPEYHKHEMIPKLSVLVYGDPGTGKSTLCKAIAKKLNQNTVVTLSASYFSNPECRIRKVGRFGRERLIRISGKGVVLIDDIDCVCNSRKDDSDNENASALGSLLAFLDTPPTFRYLAKDNVYYDIAVVVATTNYFDKLDAAVKRYGRFDLKIEMKDFHKKEAEDMCSTYGLQLNDVLTDEDKKNMKNAGTINPSYLQALCLENIDKQMKSN